MSKDPEIMKRIVDFVEAYHLDYNSSPSLRVIADGVGIGSTTVYRSEMRRSINHNAGRYGQRS